MGNFNSGRFGSIKRKNRVKQKRNKNKAERTKARRNLAIKVAKNAAKTLAPIIALQLTNQLIAVISQREKLETLVNQVNDYITSKIIIIEEGQFFTNLYEIVKKMSDVDKKIVHVTALNGDSNRELFGDIYKLLPLCDNIEFMQSLCMKCSDGTLEVYSKRNSNDHNQVCVGNASVYQAVCREHYFINE